MPNVFLRWTVIHEEAMGLLASASTTPAGIDRDAALHDAEGALLRLYDTEHVMLDTPALTAENLATKLKLALFHEKHQNGEDELDPNWKMVASALRDLEQIAAGGMRLVSAA